MKYETIVPEQDGNVAKILLNRPEVLNAINEPLLEGLIEKLEHASTSKDVRAIILKGAGRAFCGARTVLR